jgi:hypothetical protein
VPLIYFFIQHKVHKVAGGKIHALDSFWVWLIRLLAYTTYAFFEWALILFDVAFDAVTALDFETFELVVKDVKGSSKGYVRWLPKWYLYYMYSADNTWFWTRLNILFCRNNEMVADAVLEKEYVIFIAYARLLR